MLAARFFGRRCAPYRTVTGFTVPRPTRGRERASEQAVLLKEMALYDRGSGVTRKRVSIRVYVQCAPDMWLNFLLIGLQLGF